MQLNCKKGQLSSSYVTIRSLYLHLYTGELPLDVRRTCLHQCNNQQKCSRSQSSNHQLSKHQTWILGASRSILSPGSSVQSEPRMSMNFSHKSHASACMVHMPMRSILPVHACITAVYLCTIFYLHQLNLTF